jgi:hypothetical protein
MNESDLMSRLAASKAIMDSPKFGKSSSGMGGGLPPTSLQEFDMPQVKYNIPQEFLQEAPQSNQPYLSELPRVNTKPVGNPTVDAIKNSKLPDEIKKLMMEHPISQPQQQPVATLSDDLIEKASRLMKRNDSGYVPESAKPKQVQQQSQPNSSIDYKLIKKMISEAVNEALEENGLLVESSENSKEVFSFKVGKHVFEGKVTKIKKLA